MDRSDHQVGTHRLHVCFCGDPEAVFAKQAALHLYPHWRQVTFHYFGYVLRCYVGIPDVVWVDEDDGTFLMTAGACVTKHGGRRYAAQLHLFFEHLE